MNDETFHQLKPEHISDPTVRKWFIEQTNQWMINADHDIAAKIADDRRKAQCQSRRSLLVLGVPRSATSILVTISSNSLGFNCAQEIFFNGPTHMEVDLLHNEPHWMEMYEFLMKFKQNNVVKIVRLPKFVDHHFDDILEHFNVLHIRRNIKESMACHIRLDWPMRNIERTDKAFRELTDRYESDHRVSILHYEDFIHDEESLWCKIRRWYPDVIEEQYIDKEFIEKREETKKFIKEKLS